MKFKIKINSDFKWLGGNKMERQEWLDSLKVGDKVVYNTSWGSILKYRITEIVKITPARLFDTKEENGNYSTLRFNKEGRHKVTDYRSYFIQPVTNEILEKIKREKLIAKVEKVNFQKYTNEQLEKILEIVSN